MKKVPGSPEVARSVVKIPRSEIPGWRGDLLLRELDGDVDEEVALVELVALDRHALPRDRDPAPWLRHLKPHKTIGLKSPYIHSRRFLKNTHNRSPGIFRRVLLVLLWPHSA